MMEDAEKIIEDIFNEFTLEFNFDFRHALFMIGTTDFSITAYYHSATVVSFKMSYVHVYLTAFLNVYFAKEKELNQRVEIAKSDFKIIVSKLIRKKFGDGAYEVVFTET